MMKEIIKEFAHATKGRILEAEMEVLHRNEVWAAIWEKDIETLSVFLYEGGYDLVSLFCVEDFGEEKGLSLIYAFEKIGQDASFFLRMQVKHNFAPSIEAVYPSASWYQREISDGFGLRFLDSFDERTLLLHEAYPEGFHPMRKSFINQAIKTQDPEKAEAYGFRKIEGEGVYEIPVGPVHAGIIEPGHFRFSVIGETIHNLELRLFYKHRGIEKLAEGKDPGEVVRIAESISGDESIANSLAYCLAVEKILGIKVPARGEHLRMIYSELERVYSHLGSIAGMATDVAFPVGASQFLILREEILRQNKHMSGSRFLKGAVCIGGIERDAPDNSLKELAVYLDGFSRNFSDSVDFIEATPSVIDRYETTGIVKKELIKPLHITGPAARACGEKMDTRLDHPYSFYDSITPEIKTSSSGDVLARFLVKADEVKESVKLIQRLICVMPKGKTKNEAVMMDGYASALVEAPRGEAFCWVSIKGGKIDRLKFRTPSYCNWQCIQHAVLGNIVPDFPLINKSLDLSYAGTDL